VRSTNTNQEPITSSSDQVHSLKPISRAHVKKILQRHIPLILLLAGLGAALLDYALSLVFEPFYGPFDWRGWLLSGSSIFLAAVAFFYAGPPFAIYILRGHKWLKMRVFDKAIDAEGTCPLEICFACTAFNFALFTIAYLLPLRKLLVALLPPLQTIADLIPSSYGDIVGANFLWLFIPVAIGPGIVYSVRWFRHEGSERGETMVEVLQILVYVSVALPLIVGMNPGSFSGSSLLLYGNIVGVILFPGSIGGVGVLLLLERIGKKPAYIT